MPIIAETLDRYVKKIDKSWTHDRSNTVGASEVGQCARKIFWLKSEVDAKHRVARDPDFQETWGARIRGTIIEDKFWEPALRDRFGKRLLFAGKEQKTFVSDFLSATPDGMVIDLTEDEQHAIGVKTDCAMFECKSSDPRTNLNEAKPQNTFQTQVQMGIVRENTLYKPTHSVLSYTDASFWTDVKEFVIAFDQDLFDTAKQRAMTIMTATSVDETPPEGWIAGGAECRYCPFTIACGVQRRNLPFQDNDVDPQFAAEMKDAALSLRAMEKSRDTLDSDVRALQDQIKSRLREKGVRKIPGVLQWSSVKGRAGFDNKAIQAAAVEAGVDLDTFRTLGEPGDRLVITVG